MKKINWVGLVLLLPFFLLLVGMFVVAFINAEFIGRLVMVTIVGFIIGLKLFLE